MCTHFVLVLIVETPNMKAKQSKVNASLLGFNTWLVGGKMLCLEEFRYKALIEEPLQNSCSSPRHWVRVASEKYCKHSQLFVCLAWTCESGFSFALPWSVVDPASPFALSNTYTHPVSASSSSNSSTPKQLKIKLKSKICSKRQRST